ncbi:MAG: PAS domain S-box protein [Deltaproteobacteria bacterium]|nr:MAG: PAS domain S-box protein [Deltaproteobacteria bacterium]
MPDLATAARWIGPVGRDYREIDWCQTPLGPFDTWPIGLKITVRTMLCATEPTLLCWGDERVLLFNEPCAEILSAEGLHPHALGRSGAEVFGPRWPAFESLIHAMSEAGGRRPPHLPSPLLRSDGVVSGVIFRGDSLHRALASQTTKVPPMTDAWVGRSSSHVLWTADAQGRVDSSTEAVQRLAGRGAEELSGTGWIGALHPDDVDRTRRAWAHSIETGEPYQLQARFRLATGEYQWFWSYALPTRGPSGEVLKWVGSAINIHEPFQAQERAHRLAEQLTSILQSITDAFCLIGTDWRVLHVNPRAEQRLRRSKEELLNTTFWQACPELVGTAFEAALREAAQSREPVAMRYRAGEAEEWWDVRVYPSPEGLALFFRDVSGSVRAERRLRQQAELLDRAQDAILVFSLDHQITYWNRSAERMYGWSSPQVIGRSVRDVLYEAPEIFDLALAAVLRDGEWTGEIEHLCEDRELLPVEGRWSLVRDESGEPTGVLAVHTDVSERKELLSQFLRAQRLETIGTLAGGIAHDLNNVLAPILLSVAMLRAMISDAELAESLAIIETSAQRGADMVRQLLGFARGYELCGGEVDVSKVVQDVAMIVRDTFPKNISLSVQVDSELHRVGGDATQIHQVLMNLLVNARDAMSEGGMLQIEAKNVSLDEHYAAMSGISSLGAHVCLTVADSGMGMTQAQVDQIFDPFFTTKEVGKGTGLGLSTVAAITRSYGGFVQVESEVGRGSTFHVFLPAHETGAEASLDEQTAQVMRGQGELILVIDDEVSVRDITTQTLRAFGYRVLAASDGAEAIAEYAQHGHEIALVLTDMIMPVMDGPTTIRALKRMDPDVKIIGASGLGTDEAVARASKGGLEHFLPKPYTAETLLRAIRDVLLEDCPYAT